MKIKETPTEAISFTDERCLPVDVAIRLTKLYEASCKSLCQEAHLTQAAFDVLVFLANNPEANKACDVVARRGLKPTLVSVSVDRLVNLGYVRREAVSGDRRKFSLVVTPAATSIVEKGLAVRRRFYEELTQGVSPADARVFKSVMDQVSENINAMAGKAKKQSRASAAGKSAADSPVKPDVSAQHGLEGECN